MTLQNKKSRRFIAEWETQSAIMIAWPHNNTDWAYMLDDVEKCYIDVAKAILEKENLVIVTRDRERIEGLIKGDYQYKVLFVDLDTNDTWCRDFGPITIEKDGNLTLCDFKFNAWGGKFNWVLDNQVSSSMNQLGLFKCEMENCQDFILEGGSIETDGKGTLLVTSQCLLTPTRNPLMTKDQVESYLKNTLGVEKVLWLDYGAFAGDDTDSHIDTLARIAPNNSIVYAGCDDENDLHYIELKKMEEQLATFTSNDNKPFVLHKLPFPNAIYDEDGERLPATYANYLVGNGVVWVPTYNQPQNDEKAIRVIQSVFKNHSVVGIDCTALIKQHGSLHCITMQFPKNVFNEI